MNHVFEIVVEWYQTKDWQKALNKVIPERKQAGNDDTSEVKNLVIVGAKPT